jgi:Helix-turn-helix domain
MRRRIDPEHNLRPLLTERETAEILDVPDQSLRNARCTKVGVLATLPHYKLGRMVRYDPRDVERWLAERRREAVAT